MMLEMIEKDKSNLMSTSQSALLPPSFEASLPSTSSNLPKAYEGHTSPIDFPICEKRASIPVKSSVKSSSVRNTKILIKKFTKYS